MPYYDNFWHKDAHESIASPDSHVKKSKLVNSMAIPQ